MNLLGLTINIYIMKDHAKISNDSTIGRIVPSHYRVPNKEYNDKHIKENAERTDKTIKRPKPFGTEMVGGWRIK